MIKAQKMKQLGVHVVRMYGIFDRAIAEIVGRAVDGAPLDAASAAPRLSTDTSFK